MFQISLRESGIRAVFNQQTAHFCQASLKAIPCFRSHCENQESEQFSTSKQRISAKRLWKLFLRKEHTQPNTTKYNQTQLNTTKHNQTQLPIYIPRNKLIKNWEFPPSERFFAKQKKWNVPTSIVFTQIKLQEMWSLPMFFCSPCRAYSRLWWSSNVCDRSTILSLSENRWNAKN